MALHSIECSNVRNTVSPIKLLAMVAGAVALATLDYGRFETWELGCPWCMAS